MSSSSPLIRMTPFQPSELPAHPSLTSTDAPSIARPDLLPFILALLDQASNSLAPIPFGLNFKSLSHRPSPPSNTDVESLGCTFPSTQIEAETKWDDPELTAGVGRFKPREIPTENWFARRSYHQNISSKTIPATASWEEFVFGLRDNHSKNEQRFTPTLYDARHILDWNAELAAASQKWKVEGRATAESPGMNAYTDMTLAVYEMCHEVPFPLQPRCFAVLVATASTSPTRFVAVTVPVNLGSFDGAFYSTGRNRTEGEDAQKRKTVVSGIYTAVEKCELITREKGRQGSTDSKTAASGPQGNTQATGETEELIEWIMATASDAKGNVPMALQKSSMPGAVAKDVGYFLKWISTVDEAIIKGEKQFESSKRSSTSSNERNRRFSGASAAR